MLDKAIYSLSGLPRTGSTLLGSILSQNPLIHVTPTSPLYSLLVNANEHFNLLNTQYTFDRDTIAPRVYHAMIEAFYADIQQPIIFDKHRGWPKHVPAIKEYLNSVPKIICTVRPLAEIITSYIVLANKDENNFIDNHLKQLGQSVTNEARANLLWAFYLKNAYESMVFGLSNFRENILKIEYIDLVFSPQKTMNKIYDFCGLERFDHRWENIKNTCAEAKDEAWGMKNLHEIRPTLEKNSENPEIYLSQAALDFFRSIDLTI